MSTLATADTTSRSSTRTRLVLLTCLVSSALTHLESTMVVVATPRLRTDLGADDAQVQWMVSSYLVAFALVLLPAGRLGDLLGRRTMYLVGQSCFLGAALLAVTASDPDVLVAARLVQGLGAGLLLPQGSAVIQTMVAGTARASAFAMLGVSISVATASGPLLAGGILQLSDAPGAWRWLFVVTAPLSVLVIVLAYRLFPRRSGTRAWTRLDPLGTALAGVAFLGALWPLVGTGPLSERPWWSLGITAVAGPLLVLQQRRRQPGTGIVERSVLRLPQYAPGVLTASLFFAGSTAVPVVLALLLQEHYGFSALAAGAVTVPWALGNGLAAPWGGRWVVRSGRLTVATGATVTATALFVLTFALAVGPAGQVAPWVAAAMLIAGVGAGLTIGPNLSVTLARVPQENAGGASALMQTGHRLASAIGTTAAVSVLLWEPAGGRGGLDPEPGLDPGAAALLVTAILISASAITAWATRDQRA